MKALKHIKKYGALALLLAATSACTTKSMDELNVNPNYPTEATVDNLFLGAQINIFGEKQFTGWRGNILVGTRYSQFYTMQFDGGWFGGDDYSYSDGWAQNVWDAWYFRATPALYEMLEKTKPGGAQADVASHAIVRIMRDFFYLRISNQYGDMPFDDAGSGKPNPTFVAQEQIYARVADDLKSAIEDLKKDNTVDAITTGRDLLYGLDVNKWQAFANTLRLRLAMTAYDKDPAKYGAIVKECMAGKLMDSQAESGLYNSINVDSREFSTFPGTWDFCCGDAPRWTLSARVIDALKANNDPRLQLWASKNSTGEYVGQVSGTRTIKKFSDYSAPTAVLRGSIADKKHVPYPLLTVAESYFMRAEAVLRGIATGGSAEEFYQKGIEHSMKQWGVAQADIDAFLATPAAKLAGTAQENLTKVYSQHWLSLMNNGYDAWTLVRRTDIIPQRTDKTSLFVNGETNGYVPARIMYPSQELNLNGKEVTAAIERLKKNGALPGVTAGNNMGTRLWWDVK